MKIFIKGRPASKKNSRRNFGHISLPSIAHERFKTEALYQLLTQRPKEPLDVPVRIDLTFFQKGRYRQDLDNAISSVLDVLQEGRVITDDHLVQKIVAEKISGCADWETVILIEPL